MHLTPIIFSGQIGGMKKDPVVNAIEKIGGLTAVADKLGITRQAVFAWKRCPPEHAIKIEQLSGISRHILRPDVFGKSP